MTESKENLNGEKVEVYEEFPFPKFIKTFDFFFPRQKGYKPIDWRRKLRIWALWAPWVTIISLFIILCIVGLNDPDVPGMKVTWIGLFLLLVSTLKAIYYFGVAIIAKFLKRSPIVPLSLAPLAALYSLGILCALLIIQCLVFDGKEPIKKDTVKRSYSQQKSYKETIAEMADRKDLGDNTAHEHAYPIK